MTVTGRNWYCNFILYYTICAQIINMWGTTTMMSILVSKECIVPNSCHWVRNFYFCQSPAYMECMAPNSCYRIWDDQIPCQSRTSRECIVPNSCHWVRNRNMTYNMGKVVVGGADIVLIDSYYFWDTYYLITNYCFIVNINLLCWEKEAVPVSQPPAWEFKT